MAFDRLIPPTFDYGFLINFYSFDFMLYFMLYFLVIVDGFIGFLHNS